MGMRAKKLVIGYGDLETAHMLDLLDKGIEPRIVGNEVHDQHGNVVGVWVKCCGLIIKENGQVSEYMLHSIEELLQTLYDHRVDRVYFHNLKFDDSFIASYTKNDEIQLNGCTCRSTSRLMTDKNVLYSDVLEFEGVKRDKKRHRYTKHVCQLWDSAKIWASSLRSIGEDFGVYKKGEGHEEALRVGCDARMEEYCLQDCRVMMTAMEYYFERCNEESRGKRPYGWMTAGATSYHLCMMAVKRGMRTEDFALTFPPCNDKNGFPDWLREGYKGAVPLLNPEIRGKMLTDIMVFDVNSMYPDKLRNYPMPYGCPLKVREKTIEYLMDVERRGYLWVAQVKLVMGVKNGHRATYMSKRKTVDGETLCWHVNDLNGMYAGKESYQVITNVDWKMILRDYDVQYVEVLDAVAFRSKVGIMRDFIDDWYATKSKAGAEGNKPLKAFAKLILNSLYGKFGTNPEHIGGEYVFFNDLIRVKTSTVQTDERPLYLPVALFTTAYARNEISELCNSIGWEHVVYTDTDSLHVIGLEAEECKRRIEACGYRIDGSELGALDFESRWQYGLYVRNKGYLHETALDTDDGSVLYKNGKTVNETKMAGANGLKWEHIKDVIGKEMKATRTTGYRVHGGTLLMDKEVSVDTTVDACIKSKRKLKGKTQEESDKELKRIDDAIFAKYGWCANGTG